MLYCRFWLYSSNFYIASNKQVGKRRKKQDVKKQAKRHKDTWVWKFPLHTTCFNLPYVAGIFIYVWPYAVLPVFLHQVCSLLLGNTYVKCFIYIVHMSIICLYLQVTIIICCLPFVWISVLIYRGVNPSVSKVSWHRRFWPCGDQAYLDTPRFVHKCVQSCSKSNKVTNKMCQIIICG